MSWSCSSITCSLRSAPSNASFIDRLWELKLVLIYYLQALVGSAPPPVTMAVAHFYDPNQGNTPLSTSWLLSSFFKRQVCSSLPHLKPESLYFPVVICLIHLEMSTRIFHFDLTLDHDFFIMVNSKIGHSYFQLIDFLLGVVYISFILAGDMAVGIPSNGVASSYCSLLEYSANHPRRADSGLWSESWRTRKRASRTWGYLK